MQIILLTLLRPLPSAESEQTIPVRWWFTLASVIIDFSGMPNVEIFVVVITGFGLLKPNAFVACVVWHEVED
jgi:hypothetical protein